MLQNTKPSIHWKRQLLPLKLALDLVTQLRDLQAERVILTGGGDPLAYPDFETVIRHIHQSGLKTTLISNLSLVKDRDTFQHLPIDTILANCSATDAESYLAFHPNQKLTDFEKFIETLQQASRATQKLKLVFVVCRINAHLLVKFMEFAASLKASVQFKLMSISEETKSVSITEEMKFKLLQEFPDLLSVAKRLKLPTNLDTLRVSLSGQTATSFPIAETGCSVGYFYARITASGDVLFCCNPHKSLKIGSLLEHSFAELWSGEKWQHLRRQLHQKQFVAGCERCGKFDLNVANFQKITLEKTNAVLARSTGNTAH